MKLFWSVLAVASIVALSPVSSTAGLLELADDEVSRDRHCDHNPCRRNDLVYKDRYVKGRYLRYEIESEGTKYDYQPRKIVVVPPEVALKRRPGEYHYHKGRFLLVATDKPTTEFEGPVYEDVDLRVLVAPARHRVYRKRPYTAWYKDKAVIVPRCSVRDLFGYCLD
jgi:hypothetical protein